MRLAGFTSGAHGQVRKAVDKLLGQGAEGVVLDLRDNGGGLLNEAVLTSSIFVGDGTIVSTKGLHRPAPRVRGGGRRRSTRRSRSSCSSTATRRRRRRSSRAPCRTAAAPRSSGTSTFGKGVFQEIRRLSNGGALDITVGEYFTPKGRNLGGVAGKGAGSSPT